LIKLVSRLQVLHKGRQAQKHYQKAKQYPCHNTCQKKRSTSYDLHEQDCLEMLLIAGETPLRAHRNEGINPDHM
jgi:hypothetical protein